MIKTSEFSTESKILVNINNLQNMLDVGRNTAAQIGKDANAVVKIGARTLYNVKKISEYMDRIAQ